MNVAIYVAKYEIVLSLSYWKKPVCAPLGPKTGIQSTKTWLSYKLKFSKVQKKLVGWNKTGIISITWNFYEFIVLGEVAYVQKIDSVTEIENEHSLDELRKNFSFIQCINVEGFKRICT